MEFTDRLIQELIAESRVDEIGLWFIISMIETEYKYVDDVKKRLLTLDLVKRLLDTGQVVAGYYNPDRSGSIIPWKMSTADVLLRINSEWDSLGRDPNIGEIVVFVSRSLFESK